MMHGWAERLYDYSVERNKLQRAAERIGQYGIMGIGSPVGVRQEAINVWSGTTAGKLIGPECAMKGGAGTSSLSLPGGVPSFADPGPLRR